jgi:hypothetical protein
MKIAKYGTFKHGNILLYKIVWKMVYEIPFTSMRGYCNRKAELMFYVVFIGV